MRENTGNGVKLGGGVRVAEVAVAEVGWRARSPSCSHSTDCHNFWAVSSRNRLKVYTSHNLES